LLDETKQATDKSSPVLHRTETLLSTRHNRSSEVAYYKPHPIGLEIQSNDPTAIGVDPHGNRTPPTTLRAFDLLKNQAFVEHLLHNFANARFTHAQAAAQFQTPNGTNAPDTTQQKIPAKSHLLGYCVCL
jgi:hypothetical protein